MTAFRTSPGGGGLVLAPFRGVRYALDRVSDLAAVTSPPYDVIEPDGIRLLETLDPHNIVRLILPRDIAAGLGHAGQYRHAAETLQAWLAEGVLVPDDVPGLYVYEQITPTTVQRGLIGALGLRQPSDGVILPHEDVMPGPVADRLELMKATAANPDPILLMYDGGGPASDIAESTCDERPILSVRTSDGISHRLWAITDHAEIEEIGRDLLGRRAVIADGHHRYATYLRLQERMRADGRGAGPWDFGLALLVDSRRHPLELKAIHRVLPKARPEEVLDRLSRWCTIHAVKDAPWASPDSRDVGLLDGLGSKDPAFLLVASDGRWRVTGPDGALVEEAVPPGLPEAWRRLDAVVLHHAILGRILDMPDDPEHVTYHHDPAEAVRAAMRTGGVAVLMRPVDAAVVVELADSGVRMPHKSTSFGPKPRTGIVLRTFAAG